jgi:predicted nuclease with TOPRIM domain
MTELDNARKGLDEVRQKNSETADQLNKTMQENSYLEIKIQNLQDELDKVRQNKTGITDQLNKTIQEKFHLESKLENIKYLITDVIYFSFYHFLTSVFPL